MGDFINRTPLTEDETRQLQGLLIMSTSMTYADSLRSYAYVLAVPDLDRSVSYFVDVPVSDTSGGRRTTGRPLFAVKYG